MIQIGEKIEISYVDSMSKEEQIKLKNLDFIITVEATDYIENRLMGFYSKEFPGYLFTTDQMK